LRARRWLLAGGAGVGLLVLGVAAFIALEPRAPASRDGGPGCAPQPCTAPGGFELYARDISLGGGRLTMRVSFKNNTPGGGFEAVSYRHTSPADFRLHYLNVDLAPLLDAACPNWEEARVERGAGAAAGPDPLCFTAPAGDLAGAELRWTPDEGVFPIAGSISLDAVPVASPPPSPTASASR
jgi:hypothetical protein